MQKAVSHVTVKFLTLELCEPLRPPDGRKEVPVQPAVEYGGCTHTPLLPPTTEIPGEPPTPSF